MTTPGTKGHADADVTSARAHGERSNSVDADTAEQERRSAERAGHQRRLARLGKRRVELFLEGRDLKRRNVAIDVLYSLADWADESPGIR